jgi:hypothetical protein
MGLPISLIIHFLISRSMGKYMIQIYLKMIVISCLVCLLLLCNPTRKRKRGEYGWNQVVYSGETKEDKHPHQSSFMGTNKTMESGQQSDENPHMPLERGAESISVKQITLRTRWVLVCLVVNIEDAFINRVRQLDAALQDDRKADLVIFHSDFPTSTMARQLLNMSSRNVELHHADQLMWSFPHQFDPYMEDPNWQRRSKWGYHQVKKMFVVRLDSGMGTSTEVCTRELYL